MELSCEVTVASNLTTPLSLRQIETSTKTFLTETTQTTPLVEGIISPTLYSNVPELRSNVKKIRMTDFPEGLDEVSFWEFQKFVIHVYVFIANDDEPETDDAGEEESTHQIQMLPSSHLDGVWESLVLESCVKKNLLNYASAAIKFSDAGIDENVITWNRVVLLYGPPGTGKTSLCKALSHKLGIRLGRRYNCTMLLEINSHSLFSKWFSESGKKVMNLFDHIHECCSDKNTLVIVLVDEVESLTASRQNSVGNGEPGDALRVVNAMLTGLDKLRRCKNVVVLATTNMVDSTIDVAFLDRADLKMFIGPPTFKACYNILRSCLFELVRVGIIVQSQDEPSKAIIWNFETSAKSWDEMNESEDHTHLNATNSDHVLLKNCAEIAVTHGMSGRSLRKAPFLCYSRLLGGVEKCSCKTFLVALGESLEFQSSKNE